VPPGALGKGARRGDRVACPSGGRRACAVSPLSLLTHKAVFQPLPPLPRGRRQRLTAVPFRHPLRRGHRRRPLSSRPSKAHDRRGGVAPPHRVGVDVLCTSTPTPPRPPSPNTLAQGASTSSRSLTARATGRRRAMPARARRPATRALPLFGRGRAKGLPTS
jgi:hypothetical protein